MRKLRLDVEALRIDRFEMQPGLREETEGTVIGHGRQVEAPGSTITPFTDYRFCSLQHATRSCGC